MIFLIDSHVAQEAFVEHLHLLKSFIEHLLVCNFVATKLAATKLLPMLERHTVFPG